MQIDLRTVSITPLRQTYTHIAERLGADKPASRYIEGTMDVQANANFHYRPTWDPQHELFDPRRTRIVMQDWYALKDPRQFYYGTYTQARARMQEVAEADFEFVESRGLADRFDDAARRTALDFYVPLRHVAWGANMNGAYRESEYQGMKYHCCSDGCKHIFDNEPEKYAQSWLPVHQIYQGNCFPADVDPTKPDFNPLAEVLRYYKMEFGRDNLDFADSEDKKNFEAWRQQATSN